jgi:hypothetical protein
MSSEVTKKWDALNKECQARLEELSALSQQLESVKEKAVDLEVKLASNEMTFQAILATLGALNYQDQMDNARVSLEEVDSALQQLATLADEQDGLAEKAESLGATADSEKLRAAVTSVEQK